MEQLVSQLMQLAAISGLIASATLWLNGRLEQLSDRIAENYRQQSVVDAQISGQIEKLEIYSNGNREAIAHTRERFFQEMQRLEDLINSRSSQDRDLINQILSWLDKNTEFKVRQ